MNWAWRTPDLLPGETCILVFRGLVVAHGAVLPPGQINTPPHVHSDDDEDHEDDEHHEHHEHHHDDDLIASARSRHGESFVRTGFVGVESGLYTIVFFNESHGPVNTEPFAASGDEEDTWIYLSAFKDYLVKVTVGTAGLQAVVRQIPGPTEPPLSGKLAHQASLLQFGEPELPFSPWSPDNINWIENMVLIQSWEFFGVAE